MWLSGSGGSLERLSRMVDFEIFREELEQALKRPERRRGGRPPPDVVTMLSMGSAQRDAPTFTASPSAVR